MFISLQFCVTCNLQPGAMFDSFMALLEYAQTNLMTITMRRCKFTVRPFISATSLVLAPETITS